IPAISAGISRLAPQAGGAGFARAGSPAPENGGAATHSSRDESRFRPPLISTMRRRRHDPPNFTMIFRAAGSQLFEEDILKKFAAQRPNIRLHLISWAEAQILFESLQAEEAAAFRELEHCFRRVMPDPRGQATAVRFKPRDAPAVAALAEDTK